MAIENLTDIGEDPTVGDIIRIDGVVNNKTYHDPLPDTSATLTMTMSFDDESENTQIIAVAEVTDSETGSVNVTESCFASFFGDDGPQNRLFEMNITTIENVTNPSQEFTEGDTVRIEGTVTNTYYRSVAAPNVTTYLTVALSSYNVPINTQITATAEVKFSGGGYVPITATYYVPIVGIDDVQKDLLVVSFTNGYAQVSFTPTYIGIYTVAMDKIRPTPSSVLLEVPELIVTPT